MFLWLTVKGKDRYSFLWEPHLRAMGRHLPYGISQCYLPPDTSDRAPPNPSHVGWYSIYLSWRDGRLSWLSWLDSAQAGSRTSDLSITSPMPNHCTTKTTRCRLDLWNTHCITKAVFCVCSCVEYTDCVSALQPCSTCICCRRQIFRLTVNLWCKWRHELSVCLTVTNPGGWLPNGHCRRSGDLDVRVQISPLRVAGQQNQLDYHYLHIFVTAVVLTLSYLNWSLSILNYLLTSI